MSESFDPYYTWLAIPPEEQPADAYRLLGVPRFESNADVIANAADRQMAHVKAQASGPQHEWSQKLLSELTVAKRDLLNAERKIAYDERLRSAGRAKQKAKPIKKARPLPEARRPQSNSAAPARRQGGSQTLPAENRSPVASRVRPAKSLPVRWKLAGHVAAATVGLVLGYILLCWLAPSKDFLHLFSDPDEPSELAQRGDEPDPAEETTPSTPTEVIKLKQRRPKSPRDANPKDPLPQPPVDDPPTQPQNPTTPINQPEDAEPEKIEPFEKLAGRLELPSFDTIEPVELTRIQLPDANRLSLALAKPPGAVVDFRLPTKEAATNKKVWDVLLVPKSEGERKPVVIAKLVLRDQSLSFQWLSQARGLPAGQLRNCVLLLKADEQQRALPLREPIVRPPLGINLLATTDRVSIPLVDPPESSLVFLELSDRSTVAPRHEIEPNTRRVKLAERLNIDMSPAALRLRADIRGEELMVELGGRYTLNNREYPFTVDRVNKQLRSFQKQLQEDTQEVQQRTATAQRLALNIRSLQARRFPSSPGGRSASNARDRQVTQLKGEANKNLKRLSSLQKKIPDLQKSLSEMPDVIELGNALRQQSKLHYRIVLLLEHHEIDLVVTDDNAVAETDDTSGSDEESLSDADLAEVRAAIELLKSNPDDAKANATLGRYYCFQQSDWRKGVPLLARSGEQPLAAAAALDVANPDDAVAQMKVADAWFDIAEASKLKACYHRAAYWYERAQPNLTGLYQVKSVKRLEEIAARISGASGS